MKDYKLKLGAVIGFDSKKEKDMIEYINRLAEQRRLGDFISNTIRVVLENPAEVKRLGFDMNRFDISYGREKFYNDIVKQVSDMGDKIDKIYDMTLKLFMMAQFGKVAGLEQQTENFAGTQLVLQHQIRELCNTLGINSDRLYNSNKYVNMEQTSEDIMAYIMSHYSNEVNSIMNAFSMMQNKMMQFVGSVTMNGAQVNQSINNGYGNNMADSNDLKDIAKLESERTERTDNTEMINKKEYEEELNKHTEFRQEKKEKFDDSSVGVNFGEDADLDLLEQFLG